MVKLSLSDVMNQLVIVSVIQYGSHIPLDTRRCCEVESTSMTLIQRRSNVVCLVGMLSGDHLPVLKKQNATAA